MPLFVVVLLKRTIYNKETKREAVNKRRETREVKENSAPDTNFYANITILVQIKDKKLQSRAIFKNFSNNLHKLNDKTQNCCNWCRYYRSFYSLQNFARS